MTHLLQPTRSQNQQKDELLKFYSQNGFSWTNAPVYDSLIAAQFYYGQFCGLHQITRQDLDASDLLLSTSPSINFIHTWARQDISQLNPLLKWALVLFWINFCDEVVTFNSELYKSVLTKINFKEFQKKNFYESKEQSEIIISDLAKKVLTDWLIFFLQKFNETCKRANQKKISLLREGEFSRKIEPFFENLVDSKKLNSRQIYFLSRVNKIVFTDGKRRITNSIYKNIVNTTRESAKRDLKSLEKMGFVKADLQGHGRSAGYEIIAL